MSSGVIVLAPGAVLHSAIAPAVGAAVHGLVTVAAIAGVAIVAVAATVLVTRAAVAGATVLAGSLVRLEESLRDAACRQVAAECAAAEAEALWHAAAAAAVDINARLRLVRAAARRAGEQQPDLPPPVSLTGRTLAEVLAECCRAAERIEATKRHLEEKWRRSAAHLLDASITAERHGAPAEPPVSQAVHAAAPGSGDVAAEIESWLAKLDREAEPDDLRQVLDAAALAERSPNLWLIQLGRSVNRINAKLAKRRRQALEAAAYLEGLTAGEPDPDDPAAGQVVQQLERVVDGGTDLTESLRDQARWLIAERERVAETRYLTGKVRALLEEEGFDVQADFGLAGHPFDLLNVAWPGRPDHSARIRVGGGQVSHQVVAHRQAEDDDQRRADAESCAELNAVMDRLRQEIDGVGVAAIVQEASGEVRVEERGDRRRRPDDTGAPIRREPRHAERRPS